AAVADCGGDHARTHLGGLGCGVSPSAAVSQPRGPLRLRRSDANTVEILRLRQIAARRKALYELPGSFARICCSVPVHPLSKSTIFDLRIVEQSYEHLVYNLLEFGSVNLVGRVRFTFVHPSLCAFA